MEKKNITTWQQVYKLPLHLDEHSSYAWSENDTMSLMFDGDYKKNRQNIIDAINGVNEFKISNLSINGCDFFENGNYIFCVRGWGNLTGIGALNFKKEKAIKIQDGFINYILNLLK